MPFDLAGLEAGAAVPGGGELDGERLAGDPVAVAVDRLLELGTRQIADPDAIGVVELAVLARRWMRWTTSRARPSAISSGVSAASSATSSSRSPWIAMPARSINRTSTSSAPRVDALAVELEGDFAARFELLRQGVAVGGGERGLQRGHPLAEARPELGEDRQHVVVDVLDRAARRSGSPCTLSSSRIRSR